MNFVVFKLRKYIFARFRFFVLKKALRLFGMPGKTKIDCINPFSVSERFVMKKIFIVVLLSVSIFSIVFAQKATDEKAAMHIVNTMFAEMANHNPPAIAGLFTAEATLTAIIKNKEGKSTVRVFTGEAFSKNFAENRGPIREDMYAPEVKIFGDLVMVWGRYIFFSNGKISHCGVNSFHLVRTDAGWKIASISSTMEPQGCTDQEKSRKAEATK